MLAGYNACASSEVLLRLLQRFPLEWTSQEHDRKRKPPDRHPGILFEMVFEPGARGMVPCAQSVQFEPGLEGPSVHRGS